jgi:hypothetical protein
MQGTLGQSVSSPSPFGGVLGNVQGYIAFSYGLLASPCFGNMRDYWGSFDGLHSGTLDLAKIAYGFLFLLIV